MSTLMACFVRDQGQLCSRQKRCIKPCSYFNADLGQSGPCMISMMAHCQGLCAAWCMLQLREGMHSVDPKFYELAVFWQQFTNWGNFKQNSGCEWIVATNQFCPKPELAIVGKKCCGLRQSGGVGEVAEPQLFRGDALCSSKVPEAKNC